MDELKPDDRVTWAQGSLAGGDPISSGSGVLLLRWRDGDEMFDVRCDDGSTVCLCPAAGDTITRAEDQEL